MGRTNLNDERLKLGLMGKTRSSGGLNISELRSFLSEKIKVDIEDLENYTRKELEDYGTKRLKIKLQKRQSPTKSKISKERLNLVRRSLEFSLSPKRSNKTTNRKNIKEYSDIEKRYCRCLAHVIREGKVNSPYAVCHASVKPPNKKELIERYGGKRADYNNTISCSSYYANEYDLEKNGEFESVAKFHGKSFRNYQDFLDGLKN
jgi:hypothetical protein